MLYKKVDKKYTGCNLKIYGTAWLCAYMDMCVYKVLDKKICE